MAYRSRLDQLIGQSGVVRETIPPSRQGAGVIKVDGQLWSAETDWPEPLDAGAAVMVVSRTNLVLQVLPERI
jgi:membrane protein implicated in regulation of membrane protease activity